MAHDFKKFPELTNNQMQFYYLDSPHKQIVEDIWVNVEKVTDGDTIKVVWDERDFSFPVRFLDIDAPELNEGGEEAKEWLKGLIEGKQVLLSIDRNKRVGKFGRLLARIFSNGMDVGQMMLNNGRAMTFDNRNEGKVPSIEELL